MSTAPGEYLLWFRPERVRTVTWGGDPFKPVLIGSDPSQLSPRRSFAQWHQLVEGTSDPWTPADLTAARLIGNTVSDVVLQFQSVRMLIATDQLEYVSRQVRDSALPVVVADPSGRVLLANQSFRDLLQAPHGILQALDDLADFCADPADLRRRLRDVVRDGRSWRGEIALQAGPGAPRAVLLRADPVLSAPDRLLGFVLLVTDLTERRTAEAARRRFQEAFIEQRHVTRARLDSKADLVFQNLLSSVVENAQLAALEITDASDTARMPEMLESVRTSVTRTAGVLEHLIWHATGTHGSNS